LLGALSAIGGPALNESPLMPPYGYTLSKSEIEAVIAYIRMVPIPLTELPELPMRRSNIWLAVALLLGVASFAAGQALTPAEIKNPQMRALQEKHFQQLQAVGGEIQGHIFSYPFYFSRVLDLELAQQELADQRSLRFDNYGGMTVVELTGQLFLVLTPWSSSTRAIARCAHFRM